MAEARWNRRAKKKPTDPNKSDPEAEEKMLPSKDAYEIRRLKPRRRRNRHPGYTIIPEHRLWIFEK